MANYKTRSSNSSPVAVKAGGGEQGRIGRDIEITVVEWNGNYARFVSPVIISGKENWIRGDYISEIQVDTPPPNSDAAQVERAIVYLTDGTQVEMRPV